MYIKYISVYNVEMFIEFHIKENERGKKCVVTNFIFAKIQ